MYLATSGMFDVLTVKAANPRCQPNLPRFSFTHFEEFAFTILIQSAISSVLGSVISKWT
jgi:hypothetical protein